MTVKQMNDVLINDKYADTLKGSEHYLNIADKDFHDAIEESKKHFENDIDFEKSRLFILLNIAIKISLAICAFFLVSRIFGKPFPIISLLVFIVLVVIQFIYSILCVSIDIKKLKKANKKREDCYMGWSLAYENYAKQQYKKIIDIFIKYYDTKHISKEDLDFLKKRSIDIK